MSYESDNAEGTLLEWRSKWIIGLEDIEARFEELKDSRISDLESSFGDLETAIDASKEDCPCEDGIRDFVTSLPGVDEEEWVARSEVLLHKDASADEIREAGFVALEDLQSLVRALYDRVFPRSY